MVLDSWDHRDMKEPVNQVTEMQLSGGGSNQLKFYGANGVRFGHMTKSGPGSVTGAERWGKGGYWTFSSRLRAFCRMREKFSPCSSADD